MPQPLPWFNNNIDPTIRGNPNPAVYRYDEYETYDVIKAEKISRWLDFTFDEHFIAYYLRYPDCLIERFTPWDFAWAEEYSEKAYIFIKNFTGTDYYDNNHITLRDFVNRDFSLDFGSESTDINFDVFNVEAELDLIVPSSYNQETLCITWLERDKRVKYWEYEPNEFIKRYQLITTTSQTTQIKMKFGALLYCSVVISSQNSMLAGSVEQQLNNFSAGYLYENLDQLFDYVTNAVNVNFPRLYLVPTKVDYKLVLSLSSAAASHVGTTGVYPLYFHGTIMPSGLETRWVGATFTSRPVYYRACSLFYARNSYWSNNILSKSDKGYPAYFLWRNSINYQVYKEDTTSIGLINVCGKVEQLRHQAPPQYYYGNYESRRIVDNYFKVYIPLALNNGGREIDSHLFDCPNGTGNISYYGSTASGHIGYYDAQADYISLPTTRFMFDSTTGQRIGDVSIALHGLFMGFYHFPGLVKKSYGRKYIHTYIALEGYEIPSSNNSPPNYKVRYTRRYFEVEDVSEAFDINSNQTHKVNADTTQVLAEREADFVFEYDETVTKTGSITYEYYSNYNEIPSDTPQLTPQEIIDSIDRYQWGYDDIDYINEVDYPIKEVIEQKVFYKRSLYDSGKELAELPDSIRVKEIHESLQAQTFAYDDSSNARIANLGYYIERIARVLGISVNPDGTIRSIRQKKEVLASTPLPDGWNFGQWGLNNGGQDRRTGGQEGGEAEEYKDGIIYEQRCNILRQGAFDTNPVITSGDYTLCENFPQLIDEILDDLDKALGWQELGANFIPNADNSGKYITYEGLAQLQTEVAYMMSRVSQHTSQTQVAALIIQAVVYELLRATGQPITPKAFQADVGGEDLANVPYPGLASDAPSQLQQTQWILQNIAPILGALLKPKVE